MHIVINVKKRSIINYLELLDSQKKKWSGIKVKIQTTRQLNNNNKPAV